MGEAVPWAPNRAAATTPTTRAAAMERGRRLAIPDIRVRNSPRRPRCPASASGLLLFLVLLFYFPRRIIRDLDIPVLSHWRTVVVLLLVLILLALALRKSARPGPQPAAA